MGARTATHLAVQDCGDDSDGDDGGRWNVHFDIGFYMLALQVIAIKQKKKTIPFGMCVCINFGTCQNEWNVHVVAAESRASTHLHTYIQKPQ